MTSDSLDVNDLRRLLVDLRHLARRVRVAQRVTWLPLLVLAVLTFSTIPVDRYGHRVVTCQAVGAGSMCRVWYQTASIYSPLALLVAYASIAVCYVLVARARGLGTRVLPYVLTGIALAVLDTAVAVVVAHHLPATRPYAPPGFVSAPLRLVGLAGAIGLGLLVLAWLERNPALLLFTLGYLVVVVVPVNAGWGTAWGSDWAFLPPLIINGGLLLLGAIGFALADRPNP